VNQSENIGELAAALAKAQAAMDNAKKDSDNPFFKSKYADLTAIWSACREQLTANGLAIVQATDESDDAVVVVTKLIHSSGQWMEGRLRMKPVKNDPQGIGSCISYARRYALAAMVGVCTEDDDAEAATRGPGKPVSKTPKQDIPQQSGAPSAVGLKRQIRDEMTRLQLNAAQAALKTGVPGIFQLEDPEILSQVLEVLKAG
jgi:hypothetical protein